MPRRTVPKLARMVRTAPAARVVRTATGAIAARTAAAARTAPAATAGTASAVSRTASALTAIALAATALAALALVTACSASASSTAGAQPQHSGGIDPHATVAAFYGDSYTLGTGASSPDKRWSTIVSRERGWTEFNPSVNGLGFINNRREFGDGDLPDLIIAEHPDLVFVTMGLNDNFSFAIAPEAIHEQIGDDLTRLRDALPEARIVVVEPFWYTDERPASVDTIIGWVRDAADGIGADYIAGASHWTDGHPEWKAADGLHPNDEGYAEMARRMDAALTGLGL